MSFGYNFQILQFGKAAQQSSSRLIFSGNWIGNSSLLGQTGRRQARCWRFFCLGNTVEDFINPREA